MKYIIQTYVLKYINLIIFINKMNTPKIIKTKSKNNNNKNKIIKIHIDLNKEHNLSSNDDNDDNEEEEEDEREIKCIKTIIVFK